MPLPFPLWVPSTSLQYKEDKAIVLLFKEWWLKKNKSKQHCHTHTFDIEKQKTEKPP